VWSDLATYLEDLAGATVGATAGVIGTCVETLHADGTNPDKDRTDIGNFGLCHFLYYLAATTNADGNNTTYPVNGGTQNISWGEVRIYTADQWGNGGSGIVGASAQSNGIALSSTWNGFAQSSDLLTGYKDKFTYSLSWYQPPFASTYAAGTLRRYSGNAQNPDKMRVYCFSARNLSSATFFGMTKVDQVVDGIVTMSGATALAAGAIAFGVTSLAF